MEKRSIGFIGGGRITKIFLRGFKRVGAEFDQLVVFDPNEEILSNLKEIAPEIITTSNSLEQVSKLDVVFLAIHPPMILEMLENIKPFIHKNTLLVSLAPKITISQIQSVLPEIISVARMNPSAPNIINQGMNPVAFSTTVVYNDQAYIMELFGKLGKTFLVDESKIEAYAIICAMGSTYFWFQLQHLQELGVQYGLDSEEAKHVLKDMMNGTMNTLFFSDMPSAEVMDLVPVKPLGEYEETIKEFYTEKLNGIYSKIKP